MTIRFTVKKGGNVESPSHPYWIYDSMMLGREPHSWAYDLEIDARERCEKLNKKFDVTTTSAPCFGPCGAKGHKTVECVPWCKFHGLSSHEAAMKSNLDSGVDDKTNPKHYRLHPSGVECIQVTEHMNFNLGNAVKYIWRHGEKGDPILDLEKAVWFVNREIARLKGIG